jgi:5'-3' exoribonuclease 1
MGVPKFYRWLSERYPCLSEVVKEHQLPEFDNLYLDMNGIIHNCSHPNDDDPHFRITEEKIFQDIFHYIEVLFRMIQPKKVFFMAIDGVAPRAKMNQQRGRRFRSAREAELNEKKARDRGEDLPKDARFDSNCITPGTPFMCRLHEQLKYFVVSKISTDTIWHGVKVILSGHETPGEGEHKIMDFIRHEKSKPDYDPNIRHCLYGLDADLVMLGLCTHDPHFSLLREEVRFGGRKNAQKRIVTAEETTFHLLHLSLLREYLDHEFSDLRKVALTFEYDVEGIIDDWILLGFLVGNDFIPNLPHLHINKGALSDLYSTYKRVLPSLGGYINENGMLNLKRFQKFMEALAETEMDRFDEIYSDSKWLEGKTASKEKRRTVKPTPGPADVDELLMGESEGAASGIGEWKTVKPKRAPVDSDFQKLLHSADPLFRENSEEPEDRFDTPEEQDSSRDNVYHMEFQQHKREYYMNKMNYSQVTPSVLKEQAEGYVRAIQWNLHYYYNGCMSWSWYYQHHFAPWITDIREFANMDLTLEMGEPFLPFEQLLSVLPAASKELLPKELQGLMLNPSSPIIEYYPEDFLCDLNGKQQEWEAVVLIPFIDERKLLNAVQPLYQHLRPEAKARNIHGPMVSFVYRTERLGPYSAPQYFPLIEDNHALQADIWRSDWEVPISKLRKGLMVNVKLDVFFPGFPTLKHIPHKSRLKADGVRVFEQASRGSNMLLVLEDQGKPDIHEVANEFLGQEIWVSWPHMMEARVVGLRDANFKYFMQTKNEQEFTSSKENGDGDKAEYAIKVRTIAERYKDRWGVIVGNTDIVVEACLMTGRKYICGQKGKITLEKQWSKIPQAFALQTTRKDILVHDQSFTQYRTLPELFPTGSICFMLGNTQYGCQGAVVQISPEHKGRIQLLFMEPKEMDLSDVMNRTRELSLTFMTGYHSAQQVGISSHLLSRITGSIFIAKGPKEADSDRANRINIGLNLKFNKKNEEVSGYTKRDQRGWTYSTKTVQIIEQYLTLFPELFDYLNSGKNVQSDMFHHMDVFPGGNGEHKLKEISDWLKELPSNSAGRQPCGTLALDDGIVDALEKAVDEQKCDGGKRITMQVRPHLLYKPNLSQGSSLPDPDTTFRLFDRVVNVREGWSVPLGLRGTITGIHDSAKPEYATMEILFDTEFSGGLSIRSSQNRSYRMPGSALINLSHGQRVLNRKQKPTAVVTPMRDARASQGNNENYWQQRKAYNEQDHQGHKNHQQSFVQNQLRRSNSKEGSPASTAAKKGSPNTCPNITPPDPKNLPKPSFQRETKENRYAGGKNSQSHTDHKQSYQEKSIKGTHSAQDLDINRGLNKQQLEDMWQSMQGGIDVNPTEQREGTTTVIVDDQMSAQLKTLLNISDSNASNKQSEKIKVEAFEAQPIVPSVQTLFAAASKAAGTDVISLGNPSMEIESSKSELPKTNKVVQNKGAHDLMVPLQVSMKHVKQKIPPKEPENIKENKSDLKADEKVRKWLSEGEKFQQGGKNKYEGNQNKESPKVKKESNVVQEKIECDETATNVEKKSGKRRLAANFGTK